MNQHMRPDPWRSSMWARSSAPWRQDRRYRHTRVEPLPVHQWSEVAQLEADLGAFWHGLRLSPYAIYTDALLMVLIAQGINPGDAVICPSFTFCATGEVVALTGAAGLCRCRQVTFNMDIASLKRGSSRRAQAGTEAESHYSIDLFGQSADHNTIADVAKSEGVFVLDDTRSVIRGDLQRGAGSAPSGLAGYEPSRPNRFARLLAMAARSSLTMPRLADRFARYCACTVRGPKYDNVRLGLTARLDTMQATI